MRKIIQISLSEAVDENTLYRDVVALCNDGSVWLLQIIAERQRGWQRLPDIPQTAQP